MFAAYMPHTTAYMGLHTFIQWSSEQK